MKLLITTLFFIFTFTSSVAFSLWNVPATNVSLTCNAANTIFEIQTQNNQVISSVYHPMGMDYSGMFKGTLSGISLEKLEKQKAVLQKLGDSQKFSWPLEKCLNSSSDQRIFECTGAAPFTVNGVQIRPVVLRTMVNNLVMTTGTYEVFTVSIVFTVENEPSIPGLQLFEITNDYPYTRDCY